MKVPGGWLKLVALVLVTVPIRPLAGQAGSSAVLSLDSLLETRVSTAAKYSQRVRDVAASVTIITADEIKGYGFRTLDQVLVTVPGFYVSNDRNYSYIGTRGFSRPTDYNNRLLLLVNGNQVNEGVFGGAPMGGELAIPLESLDRIEIIRGPGSALYGTGAMFAVINLITRTAETLDGGEAVAEAGSYGRLGLHGVMGHRFHNGVGLMLSGLVDRSDGQDLFFPEYQSPSTNNGIAHDLDWEKRAAFLGSLSLGDLRLHGRYGSRRKAIPTASYGMAFDTRGAETWDRYGYLELDYDRQLNAHARISGRGYFNSYQYHGGFPYDTTGGIDVVTDGTDNEIVGGELSLKLDLASSNRLTLGSELRESVEGSYFSPRGTRDIIDLNVPFRLFSAYLQDEHDFGTRLSLLAGARFDALSIADNSLTPRAGLLFRPVESATLKLLYGESFRAPSVYESQADNGLIPNPKLRPERSRTLELVWQQQLSPRVVLSSSAFQYRMRRLIDLTIDTVSGLSQYRNVGTAKSAGFETGIDARLGPRLSGFASYTYQHTIDEDGNRLTNSPSHLVKFGVRARPVDWLRGAIVSRYESSRITLQGSSTDPFVLLDLNVAVTRPLGHLQTVEVVGRINNLFDTKYATPGGTEHLQAAIQQDGRNLSLELRFDL